MDKIRELLSAVVCNRLSRVDILRHLSRFNVDFEDDASFVILRYKLQHELILILIRYLPEGDSFLLALKKETEDYLEFYCRKPVEKWISCCLTGCYFKTKKHRKYIRHLKNFHANSVNLTCQFSMTCDQTFRTFDLLAKHVEQSHKRKLMYKEKVQTIEIACRCNLMSCYGKQFPNVRDFMLHLRRDHIHETIRCIFKNCDKQYNKSESLRTHFFWKHIKPDNMELKDCYLVRESPENTVTCSELFQSIEGDQPCEAEWENDTSSDIESENEEDVNADRNESTPTSFQMSYCDFLNRLVNVHFVPQSTVRIICSEYLKQYRRSNDVKIRNLRKLLQKSNIAEVEIEKIIASFEKEDEFEEAQNSLLSDHKRMEFIKENFKFVNPVEIVLNLQDVRQKKAKKDVMHYCSIVESVKNLLEDPTFMKAEANNVIPESEAYRDVKDGDLYVHGEFFKQNNDQNTYTIIMYSDAIELVNPLSAGRGRHKVIQIFFTLAEIPQYYRSKIDNTHLVAVFKEKLVKKYGYNKIYEKIVKDLLILENGIQLSYPVTRTVKAGLLMHPCDNLEAHCLGGFSPTFSSKDICRFCHIQYDQLTNKIHDYVDEPHSKWTALEYDAAALVADEEYDKAVSDLECSDEEDINTIREALLEGTLIEDSLDSSTDDDVSSDERPPDDLVNDTVERFGIKHMCPLSKLKAFHPTTGFPPDVMHDVFEGVLSQDILGIIRILSEKKWFSIEQYNLSMKKLKYGDYEATDKPYDIPEANNVKRLKGNAVSVWTHMRNFPLIVRSFIKDEDEPSFKLGLLLHDITERLMAVKFEEYELQILEERIISYLNDRKLLYENHPILGSPKPKMHFLTHYPESIRMYGPPRATWTARWESVHRLAKMASESARNYINISYTVSTRQQLRKCSVYYNGMFPTNDLIVTGKNKSKLQLKASNDFENNLRSFMSDEDFISTEVEFRSQVYKPQQLVILQIISPDELRMGIVVGILVKKKSAFLVIQQFIAERTQLRYFKGHCIDNTLTVQDVSRVADYKPISNIGTATNPFFFLHHGISYSYD